MKKPIWNTLVQVFGKVVTVGLSLVTTAVLTRNLGVEIYGNYMLITSMWLFLDSAADFGSKVIGVREAARSIGEKRKEIYIQVAWFRLVASLLMFLVGLLVILLWSGFNGIELEALMGLLMIGFTAMAGSLEIIFQTEMRMSLKVWVDILFPLIFVIWLLIWKNPINLILVFGIYLIARIVSLVVGLGLLGKLLGRFKLVKPDKVFWLNFLKQSWPMGVYMILFSGYDRAVDSILIKQLIGVRDLAFYGLAYKIYGNLIQPAYYLINSVFPILSNKKNSRKRLFWQTGVLMFLGAIMVSGVVYFLAPWIINVLSGDSFGTSVVVLRILLIAMIFAYLGHLVGFTLIALGKQKQVLVVGLISLIINIGGNLLLIPSFGINGAAWVTVLTEMVAAVLMTGILVKRNNI
jgi:O-antigen/teichoic acid export membrane protein